MNDDVSHPLLQNIGREHGFLPLRVEGTVPADLRGTLYRNGPGLFELFGERYRHLFDGDGLVTACRIGDGGVSGAARLVESQGLAAERAAGRALFDTFGTRRSGRWRGLVGTAGKNTANTSLLAWQGRLLALMEGAQPTELAAVDLSTRGPTDLGGVVRSTFSAHPRRLAARRETYAFGVQYGRVPGIDVLVLPDQGPARRVADIPLARRSFVHDFALTDKYALFFVPPLGPALLPYYLGGRAFSDCLRWQPQHGTEVIVLDLEAPHRTRRFVVEPFFCYHHVNAFPLGDGLAVDFVRLDDYQEGKQLADVEAAMRARGLARTSLVRAHIQPAAEKLRLEVLPTSLPIELPHIDGAQQGRRHRWAWLATFSGRHRGTSALADGLARLDADSGELAPLNLPAGSRPSEPIFVPRGAGPGSGYLLTVVYDEAGGSSHLAVLDALDPARPPLCRAHFGQPLPTSFHGTFVAD